MIWWLQVWGAHCPRLVHRLLLIRQNFIHRKLVNIFLFRCSTHGQFFLVEARSHSRFFIWFAQSILDQNCLLIILVIHDGTKIFELFHLKFELLFGIMIAYINSIYPLLERLQKIFELGLKHLWFLTLSLGRIISTPASNKIINTLLKWVLFR